MKITQAIITTAHVKRGLQQPSTNNIVMVDGFIVPLDSLPPEYQQLVKEARTRGEDLKFFT